MSTCRCLLGTITLRRLQIIRLCCPLRTNVAQSLASQTPSGPMLKVASRSGRDGEATILHCLFSPLPFFSHRRVVEACAMMLPPIGFTDGPANMLAPSRFAATTCTWHQGLSAARGGVISIQSCMASLAWCAPLAKARGVACLVCHNHCAAVFICKPLEAAQEAAKTDLPG